MSKHRPQVIVMLFNIFIAFVILVVFSAFVVNNFKSVFIGYLHCSEIFYIPTFVILLGLSLTAGLLIYIIMIVVERFEDRKMERLLYYLVNGEYDKILSIHSELDMSITDSKSQNIILLAKILQKMNEKLVELSQYTQVVEGEEKSEILRLERLRLSRELHDSVSQQLFAAMMILSSLDEQAKIPESFEKQLKSAISVIHAAQSEMRALLLHLRPVELSGKSLHEGIEHLLQELQTKVQFKLVWKIDDVSIDASSEDHLFRILQELLSNSLRHAKAEIIEVYLKQTSNMVQLLMVDDGVGFDVNELKTLSYGLTNIHERVENMGGVFKVVSFKGQGTRIEIRIPYKK
ncbi:MAG: sensor histidine kinase [Streptococcaceae bacterium]|jgi:NarL family two-component system sensor histidine kinase LiaS|nr:sensor histidine kinase [Streptococcaceae bacterium]